MRASTLGTDMPPTPLPKKPAELFPCYFSVSEVKYEIVAMNNVCPIYHLFYTLVAVSF